MGFVLHRFLTEAEERRLFSELRRTAGVAAERDIEVMNLMRASGIRVGAMVRFTVSDARLAVATREIVLRAEIQKRAKAHSMLCTKRARLALVRLLKLRKAHGKSMAPDAPLLFGREGAGDKPMSERALEYRFKFWAKKAGLPSGFSPHWLRHTLGQRIVQDSTADNPLQIAADVLGHEDINTTRIYTRPTREHVAMALQEAGHEAHIQASTRNTRQAPRSAPGRGRLRRFM